MEQVYKYKIYVRCMTFNHEGYIKDALDGFVKQETTFPVVHVIVDDASTDKTAKVISEYVNEHFDWEDKSVAYVRETEYARVLYARHKTNENCFFAVLLLKENHYSQRKSKRPYYAEWEENAKYCAVCEGDDYWTAPDKLQKQVEFLETHPDYSMCFHSVKFIYPSNKSWIYSPYPNDVETCPIEDYFKVGGGYAPTCSMVYDWRLLSPTPSFRKSLSSIGDSPLILTLFLRGKVRFMKDVMSYYRVDSTGSWSERQKHLTFSQIVKRTKELRNYWDAVDQYTSGKYSRLIRQRKRHTWLSLGKSLYFWFCNLFSAKKSV